MSELCPRTWIKTHKWIKMKFWFLETKTQISSYEYVITTQIRILIHFIFPKPEQIRKNVSFNTLVDQNKSFLIQWPVQRPGIEVQFLKNFQFQMFVRQVFVFAQLLELPLIGSSNTQKTDSLCQEDARLRRCTLCSRSVS